MDDNTSKAAALEPVTTVGEVIHILGGVEKVGRLTSRRRGAVYKWKADGLFPASCYLVMSRELEALGYRAPPALWRQRSF